MAFGLSYTDNLAATLSEVPLLTRGRVESPHSYREKDDIDIEIYRYLYTLKS